GAGRSYPAMDFALGSAAKIASSGIRTLPKASPRQEIRPPRRTGGRTIEGETVAERARSKCPHINRISPTLRRDDGTASQCGSFAEFTDVFNILAAGFR